VSPEDGLSAQQALHAAEQALRDLVAAARAGEEDAFGRLVELKRDLVFRVAFQHVGNADDARLVTQAVFVRLWRHLDRYDPARRFDTWLYQVTVNASIDHHRRGARRRREQSLDDLFHVPAAEPLPAAERRVEAAEVQRIMAELAAELPARQRTAFLLREVEGLTTGEVAEALGTSESTVRNHVLQARRHLQQALRARYPEYAGGRRTDEDRP
jgi:RNA polymerase sigma-70 factor (ECF subfamily)